MCQEDLAKGPRAILGQEEKAMPSTSVYRQTESTMTMSMMMARFSLYFGETWDVGHLCGEFGSPFKGCQAQGWGAANALAPFSNVPQCFFDRHGPYTHLGNVFFETLGAGRGSFRSKSVWTHFTYHFRGARTILS